MSGLQLTDAQRRDWLRLIRSDGIGPRTFRALVNRHGGAGAALQALPDVARQAGRRDVRIFGRSEADREIEDAARLGGRFVAQGEPDYPKTLLAIDTAPPLIAILGAPGALARPTVAIVGSRNASAAGGTFTERLSAELGAAGFTIVSGLARGIDTRAHRAALATGTVAVLAGGLQRIYPDENRPLVDRIVEGGGAIVSEMPLRWEPRGRDFPRRNRIVSGLSYGVVVVEAARRSGSLITARFAGEQGREVFAVPGSPLDPRSEGTNDLIRGGATLCTAAEHVTAVLEPLIGREPLRAAEAYREPGRVAWGETRLWDELDLPGIEPPPTGPDDGGAAASAPEPSGGTARLVTLLSSAPVSVDDLARQADLPIRSVQLALVELELAGRIERHGGNAVSLLAPR